MPISQQEYFKKPEETIEQYNQRIAALRGEPSVISGENIQPTTEIPYVGAETPSVSLPIIPETPTYEPTPKETELSQMIRELTATTGLVGEKEAYRIEQEKAAGLETLRTSEADYMAQLRQLEADWKNIEYRMQEQTAGRGITVGGLAPLTASEQRQLAMRANTVSALLAATQGKLTFAQQQVDRAVEQKYAVAEAERKAKLENLELLSRDPTLTVEQQKRAAAQTTALKREEEADKKKKEDTSQIMKWAIELATNPAVAQQLMKMAQEETPDLNVAFALYSQNKPKEVEKLPTQIVEIGGRKLLVNTQTGETIKDLGSTGSEGANVYGWFDELINLNPDATYEELAIAFRNEKGEALSDSELRNYLELKGKKTAKERERTRTDIELEETIRDGYKGGMTKEDIIVDIERNEDVSQSDKDRTKELINEIIPEELNDWLKKVKSEPNKYEIRDDGIYEKVGFWTLRPGQWKKVYSF